MFFHLGHSDKDFRRLEQIAVCSSVEILPILNRYTQENIENHKLLVINKMRA